MQRTLTMGLHHSAAAAAVVVRKRLPYAIVVMGRRRWLTNSKALEGERDTVRSPEHGHLFAQSRERLPVL